MEELLKTFLNSSDKPDITSMLPTLLTMFQNNDKKKDADITASDHNVALYELMR